MAEQSTADQPSLYTLDQLRELWAESDGHLGMLKTIEASPKGSEVVLPLTDGSQVRYVWDGDTYLFRADTKPAAVLRRDGERLVRKHG